MKKEGEISTNLIKEVNLKLLRMTLREIRISTKPQLSQMTGLSVVTINSLVRTLLEKGEIFEEKQVQAQLGRPATAYRYNADYKMALVIYMHEKEGCDTTFFAVCNLCGDVVEKIEMPLKDVGPECFNSDIERLLQKYAAIKAIGFGVPGREVNGRLAVIDYLGLKDTQLSRCIREKFGLPVFVENDVKAATFGCCHNLNSGADCVVGLYFPSKYAAGSGICLNGELVKGSNGMAGEIQYLPFDIDWTHVGEHRELIGPLVAKTVRAFMALYNPDRVVIYSELDLTDIESRIRQDCRTEMELLMIPEIIRSQSLNADFEKGMIRLALREIGV